VKEVTFKSSLVRLVEIARSEELNFISGLSHQERNEVGTYQCWSAKDHLGHIFDWKDWNTQTLNHILSGTKQIGSDDFESVNRDIYERHKDDSWEETVAFGEKVHDGFMTALEKTSDADLKQPGRIEWLGDRPLWRRIWGTLFVHPLTHISYYLEDKGRFDEGERIQDLMYEETCLLDEDPQNTGTAAYNLACYHARDGKKERALEILIDAFKMAPNLKSWATQDSDLINIHDDQFFLEMVKK
jgi:hypothetical protein